MFLNSFRGKTAAAILAAVAITAATPYAFAQAGGAKPAEKKYKDAAEYDAYSAVIKDVGAKDFNKAIADLATWKQKYPTSDYHEDRDVLFIQAYSGAKQLGKAIEYFGELDKNGIDAAFTDPGNAIKALFATVVAIGQDTDATPEQLAIGEKAAQELMDYNHKPAANITDEAWAEARTKQLQPPAKAALLYIAMLPGNQAFAKKDYPAAEAAYTKALQKYPDNAAIAYQLGMCLRNEGKRSEAAYEFLRATSTDATLGGAQKAETIQGFVDKYYVNLHGSDEGLDALKASVKASPLPPAGFKIKTATEIAEEKQAEFEKSNPQLALWMKIKGALADTNGDQYFAGQLKDSAVPQLRGVLVDAKPACKPKELVVAVPLPGGTPTPEITLKLETPLTGKPELNSEFHWEGIPSAFTKDPSFMLTMTVEKEKIEGLKISPCVTAPAGVRKKKG
jgi:tetratricopeptide (TPR) repeat protein